MKPVESDIVLLCNPAAGGRWKQLAGILDSAEAKFVRRVVTDEIADVGAALVSLSQRTKLVCIYGGDGTIQRLLDALYANPDLVQTLPQLAFIGGGTMNVGARWCGLTQSPLRNFRDVVRAQRRGELSMREASLLRVQNGPDVHYGFTFGMGPAVRILNEYEHGRKGKVAALVAAARAIAAAWSPRDQAWQPVVAEMAGTVSFDGQVLPYAQYMAVFCSVTGTINPFVKPFVRSRTPESFYALAYGVSAREVSLALPGLLRGYLPIDTKALLQSASTWKRLVLSYFGQGVVPSDPRYVNVTARTCRVESAEKIYTVDGELLDMHAPVVDVTLGPQLRLAVSPTAELGPVMRLAADIARAAPGRQKPE